MWRKYGVYPFIPSFKVCMCYVERRGVSHVSNSGMGRKHVFSCSPSTPSPPRGTLVVPSSLHLWKCCPLHHFSCSIWDSFSSGLPPPLPLTLALWGKSYPQGAPQPLCLRIPETRGCVLLTLPCAQHKRPAWTQLPQKSQAPKATCSEMVKRIDRMDLEARSLAKDYEGYRGGLFWPLCCIMCGVSESTGWTGRRMPGRHLILSVTRLKHVKAETQGTLNWKETPLGYGERLLGGWSQGPSGLFLAPRMEANRIAWLCSEEGTSMRKAAPSHLSSATRL